jgi:integrase
MAKAKRGTRILTWHEPSSQWRKMFQGRLYYLGRGRCKTDRESYNEAVRRWKQILATADHAKTARSPAPERDELNSGTPAVPAAHGGMDVKSVMSRFLAAKRSEAKAQEISRKRVEVLRYGTDPFVQRFGDLPIRSIGPRHLEEYRLLMLKKKEEGQLKASSINLYFSALKAFFNWAWNAEILDTPPRNIKALLVGDRRQQRPEKKYFNTDEIQAIFAACRAYHERLVALGRTDPRRDLLTTALLLGLNCGYTQADIADLRVLDVQLHGKIARIKRFRSKTDVRSNHPLWRKTIEMLRPWLDGRSEQDLVFRWDDGRPIMRRKDAANPNDPIGDRFRNVIRQTLGTSDARRFRELRRTSADRCAQRRGVHVAAWFLAHKDASISSRYYDPPQRELDVMVAYLEQDYGFAEQLDRAIVRKRGKGKPRSAPKIQPLPKV